MGSCRVRSEHEPPNAREVLDNDRDRFSILDSEKVYVHGRGEPWETHIVGDADDVPEVMIYCGEGSEEQIKEGLVAEWPCLDTSFDKEAAG